MSNIDESTQPTVENLSDTALDDVQGGIALLLPAVQAARSREAAVLDFALTGDDSFSKKSAFKAKS